MDNSVKKREWVKTAAIIFLAILLVLTFFSNTIMNATLPEVAAQQIEGLFVSPLVIGDAARLHPGLVILSLIAGGWAAGLPGMFYALPAVLSLRATLSALLRASLQR